MIIVQWWRICRSRCCCRRREPTKSVDGELTVHEATDSNQANAKRAALQEPLLEVALVPEGPFESLVDSMNNACRICLEAADVGDYQVCACRGSQGFAHIQCLADLAASKWPSLEPWRQCPTCKQNYVDHVHLALSKALWEVAQDKSADVRRAAAGQLGLALFANSDFGEAAAIHRETLASCLEALGWEHPDTLASANNLAMALRAEGKASEAEMLYTEAVEVMKRVFGPEDPDTLATASNLGLALLEQEKWAEATTLLEESLESTRRVLGRDSPRALTMAANLAMALEAQKRFPEAVKLHQERLQVLRQVCGRCHEESLMATEETSRALCAFGATDGAIELQKRTLQEVRADLGRDHPYALAFQKSLAHTFLDVGLAEQASQLLRRTLVAEQANGAEPLQVSATQAALGSALRMKGDLDEAIVLLSDSGKAICEQMGDSHPQAMQCTGSLGLAYAAKGEKKKAAELQKQLTAQLKRVSAKQLTGVYSEVVKLELQLQDQLPPIKVRLWRLLCFCARCGFCRRLPLMLQALLHRKQHEL